MCVKFLQRFRNYPEAVRRPSDEYKSGFDRCIWTIENFLERHSDFSAEKVITLKDHLRSLSRSLREEIVPGGISGCSNGGGKMRVRTSLDRTFLKSIKKVEHVPPQPDPPIACPSLKFEDDARVPNPTEPSAALPVKLELRSPSWVSHSFPPSPPDSSRCSSSPDSLRGSPRHVLDQRVPAPTPLPCCSKIAKQEHANECPPFYPMPWQDAPKPLNLSIPRQEKAYPLPSPAGSPSAPVKHEEGQGDHESLGSTTPWAWTNSQWQSAQDDGAGPSKPILCPKKETLKRYQNHQGLLPSNEGAQGTLPWRPWLESKES